MPGRSSGAGARALQLAPAEGLTAFRVPEGLKDSQIRNKLTERFGITTVGGQDKLKGKIIRIGHMGYTDELDVISTLAALEMTLAELGYDVEPGRAVTAAQQVLIGQKERRSAESAGRPGSPGGSEAADSRSAQVISIRRASEGGLP